MTRLLKPIYLPSDDLSKNHGSGHCAGPLCHFTYYCIKCILYSILQLQLSFLLSEDATSKASNARAFRLRVYNYKVFENLPNDTNILQIKVTKKIFQTVQCMQHQLILNELVLVYTTIQYQSPIGDFTYLILGVATAYSYIEYSVMQ